MFCHRPASTIPWFSIKRTAMYSSLWHSIDSWLSLRIDNMWQPFWILAAVLDFGFRQILLVTQGFFASWLSGCKSKYTNSILFLNDPGQNLMVHYGCRWTDVWILCFVILVHVYTQSSATLTHHCWDVVLGLSVWMLWREQLQGFRWCEELGPNKRVYRHTCGGFTDSRTDADDPHRMLQIRRYCGLFM